MELKNYQFKVLEDLNRYLELFGAARDGAAAYCRLWEEKGVAVGREGVPAYQDIIPGVPVVCFKVPTGGGKTFLACSAIRPIFEALPFTKVKAVVWLVPSDAILAQTLKCLKTPGHPYRQQLERDFGMSLEVYSKQELLDGQNFNPVAVAEQLSVMVLSYDSFRRHNKEGLKAFQENSAMMNFARVLGRPELPIEGADETSLFQVINQLSPLVIVDESHHARGELSLEMLRNFNPCFVLDLTATPRKESNIISYVDAWQLKQEQMVKIPVIVYNRETQEDVLEQAVALRDSLERTAERERQEGGQYIRPIVLLQAQPKGGEDSSTFERIRGDLVEGMKIPAEQVAIRTADVNELKDRDLTSPDCPVRYIITVNALREGWDCPFAYILASLANRTSLVDVEQVLGRVLRMPGARKNPAESLNVSYVLTSSSDFNTTVRQIVAGLNGAGFTERDFRAPELKLEPPRLKGEQGFMPFFPIPRGEDHPLEPHPSAASVVERMLSEAQETSRAYEREEREAGKWMPDVPAEVRARVRQYPIKAEFRDEAAAIVLPQFFCQGVLSLLEEVPLRREYLTEGFTLRGQDSSVDFGAVDAQIRKIDVQEGEGGVPKVFNMTSADQRYYLEWFGSLTQEGRIRECRSRILDYLDKRDELSSRELDVYVQDILDGMDAPRLNLLERDPQAYAARIWKHIEGLLDKHYKRKFDEWLQTGRIACRPSWRFPAFIHPTSTSSEGGSLYESEESMNEFEIDLVLKIASLGSVQWWHRNISKRGFCLNGFINHYPDLILRTQAGRIVLVEPKGAHLNNDDSREKNDLGRTWASLAGPDYRYFMVFQSNAPSGAYNVGPFLDILGKL